MELVEVITELHRSVDELGRDLDPLGVSPRQAQAVFYANIRGAITRADYIEITGVSPVTASRDLAKLLEFGMLVAEGSTRNRVYRPLTDRKS